MAEKMIRRIEVLEEPNPVINDVTGQTVLVRLWLNGGQTNNMSLTRDEAKNLRDALAGYLAVTE